MTRLRTACVAFLPLLFFLFGFCSRAAQDKSPQTCENFNLVPGDFDFPGLSDNDKVLALWLYARCVHERENSWCRPLGSKEPAVSYRCKRARSGDGSLAPWF